MTAPVNPPSTRTSREENFIEWFQRNRRLLSILGVVVLVVGGAYWYHIKSVELTDQAAERELNTALQSVQVGNKALAESDLQKVVQRYGNTQSGLEAGMVLAQLHYNDAKYAEGIAVLEGLQKYGAAKLDGVSLNSLLGDGQMQAGQAKAAAASYQKAADAAASSASRAFQQGKAARAFLAAGDTATASQIWQKLAADPDNQSVAAEARVRLGEIQAKPASKG